MFMLTDDDDDVGGTLAIAHTTSVNVMFTSRRVQTILRTILHTK